MLSENRIIFAGAGARKTQLIVDDSLDRRDERSLITTYTNANLRRIADRIGHVPPGCQLVPWQTFLLRDGAKPYQPALLGRANVIRGVDFDADRPRYAKKDEPGRYFLTRSGNVYGELLSDLACQVASQSQGATIRRLEEFVDHLYIDELQDLVGWDLEFLDLILRSEISVTAVGDPRQFILSTNPHRKNEAFRGHKLADWFGARKEVCDLEYHSTSYRCNRAICDFASNLFPNFERLVPYEEATHPHQGIIEISRGDVPEYVEHHRPLILRHNRTTNTMGLPATNVGLAKGATSDHVLIFPTKAMKDYWASRDLTDLTSPERLYVAVTRARYSVAFVI